LPEPDTPVTTTSLRVGTETSIPFRLWTRTPRAVMEAGMRSCHARRCFSRARQSPIVARRTGLLVVEGGRDLLPPLGGGGARGGRLGHPRLEGEKRRVDLGLLADRAQLTVELLPL